MQGWIKLYRQIWDNPLLRKDNDFFVVWIYLLSHATHKEITGFLGGLKTQLKPGQLITGRKIMAQISLVSESKIERVLLLLESEQQIKQQKSNKNRLITILNWDSYQLTEQQNEQQMDNNGTTTEQQLDTYKNVKKVKKERVTSKKEQYPNSFETIRSQFPYARSGSKKETYEEFKNKRTEEELVQEIKILKRQIKFDPAVGKFLPAMQRWLKNLPKSTPENTERKIEQLGFIVAERSHNGDTTDGKTFCEDFGEDIGRRIMKKWYKKANSIESYK